MQSKKEKRKEKKIESSKRKNEPKLISAQNST